MPGKVQIEIENIKLARLYAEELVVEKLETVVALPVLAIEIIDQEFYILELTGISRRDGVLVSGIVFQQVVYLDEDKLLRYELEEIPFQYFVTLPGLKVNEHQVQLQAKLVGAEGKLIEEGHAIFTRLSVQIVVTATRLEQVQLITEVAGINVARVSKKRLAIQTAVKEINIVKEISRAVRLTEPAISVFWIITRFNNISADTVQDFIKVKGTVLEQIYYIDQNNRIKLQTENFPVNITVSLPGIAAGEKLSVEGTAIARRFTLLNAPADKLEWKLKLEIKATVTGWRFLEAVDQVSGRSLQVTRTTHPFKQFVREMELTAKVQTSIDLPAAAACILQVDAVLTGISVEIFDGEVIARGVLSSRFIFLDTGDTLRCYRHELSVSIREKLLGAKPSFGIQVLPGTVSQISYQAVAPSRVEQSVEIRLPVIIFEESGLEVVSKIKAASGSQRIYKLYIIQEGDTWVKIAGRFGVPSEVLICTNIRAKGNDRLCPKQMIYIPLNR